MINPYEGVNWGNVKHIHSTSHMHSDLSCKDIADMGFQHLAISDYYPSHPATFSTDPKNWFYLPDGVVGSPNAEHHNSIVGDRRNGDFHFNGLGSTWESGNLKGVDPIGIYDKTWQTAFDLILSELKVPDGGGITINHPNWYSNEKNKLTQDQIEQFLQHDSRVLGIEIFNAPVEEKFGWAIDVWDNLLKKGIRAWGFCVTDHPTANQGRNVLLIDEDKFKAQDKFKGEECLRAYRKGQFYGKIFNSDLRFEEIKFENNVLTVRTNNATAINIVVDGKSETFKGTQVTYTVPKDAVYVRAEAHTDTEYDYIYTNPFMLDPQEEPRKKRGINKLMWY